MPPCRRHAEGILCKNGGSAVPWRWPGRPRLAWRRALPIGALVPAMCYFFSILGQGQVAWQCPQCPTRPRVLMLRCFASVCMRRPNNVWRVHASASGSNTSRGAFLYSFFRAPTHGSKTWWLRPAPVPVVGRAALSGRAVQSDTAGGFCPIVATGCPLAVVDRSPAQIHRQQRKRHREGRRAELQTAVLFPWQSTPRPTPRPQKGREGGSPPEAGHVPAELCSQRCTWCTWPPGPARCRAKWRGFTTHCIAVH